MADVVGEAKIVLDADTALLIRQIETLKLPPVKVRVELDTSGLRAQKISPKLELSDKVKTSLRRDIQSTVAQAAGDRRTYLLTGTKFEIGAAAQKRIQTGLSETVRKAVAMINATAPNINVGATINQAELGASALEGGEKARATLDAIFAKPIHAFINTDISGAVGAFSRFEVASKRIFKSIGLAWGATTAGIVAGTAALGVSAIKTFEDVESSATNAASIIAGNDLGSGRSLAQVRKNFDGVKEQFITGAQDIAKKTIFSAKEAADGYYFLASAGESAADSLALLPQIAKFAQAGQLDLEGSTESLLQSFNALGLNFGTFQDKQKNIVKLTDILTAANVDSLSSMQDLADALRNKTAVSFTQFGQSVETTIAALQQLSSVGVTGRLAGTNAAIAAREVFTKGKENKDIWKKQGLAVFDAAGNYRKFGDIIADLTKKFNSLNDEGKTALLHTLGFTDKASQGLRALITAEGKTHLSDVVKDLEKASGLTAKIAGLQQTSFKAVFQNFQDAINSLLVEAGKIPAEKLNKFFDSFNKGNKLTQGATSAFKKLGQEFGVLTDKLLGFVSGRGLPALLKGLNDLAVGTFKGLEGFGKSFGKAFGGENQSIGESFGAVLTQIGLLSERVFPQIGESLGQITKFIVDNQDVIIPATKAWLEFTAAIFAIRVVVLPLQQFASAAVTIVEAIGGAGGLAGIAETAGAAISALGIEFVIAGVAIYGAWRNSQDFRDAVKEMFTSVLDLTGAIGELVSAFDNLAVKVPYVSDAFRILGAIGARAIRATLVPIKGVIALLKILSKILRGDLPGAFGVFKSALFNTFDALSFGHISDAIALFDALRGHVDQLKNSMDSAFVAAQKLINTNIQGPVQGPGIGANKARDDAFRLQQQQFKALQAQLKGTATLAEADDKAQKKRASAAQKAVKARQDAEDKIRKNIQDNQKKIEDIDKRRKDAIKNYFEGVKRAAEQAKQAISDYGDAIKEALIGNLNPLKAQADINASFEALFKTLRSNRGVLAGVDTTRARENLNALSDALSQIGDAAASIAEKQGAAAVKPFLATEIGDLLKRAQDAFASGKITADQLKQIQDQANQSLAAAGAITLPVKFQAVDDDGKPITDPRKNGTVDKLNATKAQLVAQTDTLKQALGGLRKQAKPAGNSLIVGFTDGVKEQWTTQAKPYLAHLGQIIPNGLGGTIVLRKSMTPHGEAVILGLQDGMKDIWSREVTPFVKDIAPWIAANKGPIAADRALLIPHGKSIMDGFLEGLKEGWNKVKNFITAANAQVQNGISSASNTAGMMGGEFHGKFENFINAEAKKFNLDPLLVASVIKQESGFNPKAVSPAGAQGLGQLMPGTAKALGVHDPFDPKQNIMGTAKYLSQLLAKFGGNIDKALAAYNAGPGAVQHFGGIPPFAETRSYVEKVESNLESYKKKFGTKNLPEGFPLDKTAQLASTMWLDDAKRLVVGPAAAIGKEMGLGVSFHGGIHGGHAKKGYHPRGLAIDMSGPMSKMTRYAEYVRKYFKPSELLSPLGASYNGSSWQPIADAALRANHQTHVHVGNPKNIKSLEDLLRQKIHGKRYMGGSVESGKSYLVGERGPEVVTFGNSGEVMSNDVMKRLLAKMDSNAGHQAPLIGNVTIQSNASNPSAVAMQTAAQLQGRLMRI